MPRLARTLGALVLLAGAAACVRAEAGEAIPAGRSDHTIVVGGLTRTFHLYRPDSLPAAVPLVVMLHGGFGSGAQAERDYGWDTMADTGGFVVAYPDGFGRAWNAGAGCCGRPGTQDVDDVAFVAAVVTRIRRDLPVDPSRVYAAGMSNGAMLAYRLACDTDLFAAIAPVAGTLLGPCPRPRPVSLLHIHGTADQRVPYDGSRGIGQSAIDGPPVPDLITRWRTAGGCGAATVRTEGPSTISTATCANGRAIELITVAGAGHQWPGGAGDRVLLDKPSDAFDATATIWSFFAGHPRAA
ncbi:PHB depolymerase family esterase [Acrocarpospora sp. B8E8]|uniref:extracellular catalytic domain type 1 short-chain-length polyhydroxyalkanoate depolymerase n=1 Tax=Acrocarpospora sp. B8E8 TaxID=3153572 RepID=UPI00325F1E68